MKVTSRLVCANSAPEVRRSPLRAPPVAALVLVFVSQALQPGGDFLLGLHQDVQQVLGDVSVFIVEEGRGQTCGWIPFILGSEAVFCDTRRRTLGPTSLTQVPHSSRSSDAVDVLLDVAGQVEVDDVLNVGDVQTTSGDLWKAKKTKKQSGTLHTGHKAIHAGGENVPK